VIAFTAAVDVLFADPNLSEAAIWRPGGVGGTAVRVVRRRPDVVVDFGASRALVPTVVIDVRRSEAPTIDEGDLIVIGADTFRVVAPPAADALGLVLTCEAARV
jgi:hypothetical protein